MRTFTAIIFTVALALVSTALYAETIRIVAPYVGPVTNVTEYSEYGIDLEDTGLMGGLYFQMIDPEAYQWNAFVYHSPDVNYSRLWGGHFIYDRYFGHSPSGKFLLGAGIEYIRLDMDGGDNITGTMHGTQVTLQDFTLENTIVIPYARGGKYFLFGRGPVGVSVLPWAGVQPEFMSGKVEFSGMFGPPPPRVISESLDDTSWYGIAGINLKVNLYRFIDIEGKYQATFNGDVYHPTISAIVNLFVTRNWGLSYRYKYMETSYGSDSYHLAGVAYVF
jgi:hypothetical protein